jgi:hypothetical protein
VENYANRCSLLREQSRFLQDRSRYDTKTLMKQTKLFASSEVPIFQVFSDKHTDTSANSNDHMQEGTSKTPLFELKLTVSDG